MTARRSPTLPLNCERCRVPESSILPYIAHSTTCNRCYQSRPNVRKRRNPLTAHKKLQRDRPVSPLALETTLSLKRHVPTVSSHHATCDVTGTHVTGVGGVTCYRYHSLSTNWLLAGCQLHTRCINPGPDRTGPGLLDCSYRFKPCTALNDS